MDTVRKLEILIPQYNENDAVIKPLLDSIALQQGIRFDDIGVIICNDGSGIYLSDELLNSYTYEITYHKLSHHGVSATRNACLDMSSAEYVMFCDADDMFLSVLGLWLIFDEMDHHEFDDLTSEFLAEEIDKNTGKISYGIYDRDGVFIHGKVFRRQYLIENGIRFNENLTICEDCNFVALAQSLTDNHRYVSKSFYIWKWREGSVSRKGESFAFDAQMQMLESNKDLLEKLIAKELFDIAAGYAVQMVLNFYYMSTSSDWTNRLDSKEYRMIFKGYSDWFKRYDFLWKGVSEDDKAETIDQLFGDRAKNDPIDEVVNVENWLIRQCFI